MLCNMTRKAQSNRKRDNATVQTMRLTFRSTLLPVRLHCYVRVQVIQCAIRLFTSLPSTFVHSLNFFVAAARALVLLSAWNGNEGVDLRERVRILRGTKSKT